MASIYVVYTGPRSNIAATTTTDNPRKHFYRNITTERLHPGVYAGVSKFVQAINEHMVQHNTTQTKTIHLGSTHPEKLLRADNRLSFKQNVALNERKQECIASAHQARICEGFT